MPSKRPANGQPQETRTQKRRASKGNNDVLSKEEVKTKGLEFMEMLKRSKDKNHANSSATRFLKRPTDGYDFGFMFWFEDLERKLNNYEYDDLDTLERDFKRIVYDARQRAAQGNVHNEWHRDAERLRKTASNWMRVENRMYSLVPDYVCEATDREDEIKRPGSARSPTSVATPTSAAPPTVNKRKSTRNIAPPPPASPTPDIDSASSSNESSEAGAEQEDYEETMADEPDFSGLSYQQAQELLIKNLINFRDGNLRAFKNFENPPSRKTYPEYYEQIKHVTALRPILSRIEGRHAGKQPTGVTEFNSWDELFQEVAYIWNNCRNFNEDNSEIVQEVNRFQTVFESRFARAKAKAPEPRTSLKLNMPRTEQRSGTTSGMKLDLRRRSTPAHVERSSATPATRASATPLPPPAPDVTSGIERTASPAKLPAATPTPLSQPPGSDLQGPTHPQDSMPPPQNHPAYEPPQIVNGFEKLRNRIKRKPGQTAKDSLVREVLIQDHPDMYEQLDELGVETEGWRTRPDNDECIKQSAFILDAPHTLIQIKPKLALSLIDGTRSNNKVYVAVDGVRLEPAGYIRQVSTFDQPYYEWNLHHGGNRVEVVVAAGPAEPREQSGVATRGASNPSRPSQKEISPDDCDIDKFVVHLHRNRLNEWAPPPPPAPANLAPLQPPYGGWMPH